MGHILDVLETKILTNYTIMSLYYHRREMRIVLISYLIDILGSKILVAPLN
jgi:hypothetical protein